MEYKNQSKNCTAYLGFSDMSFAKGLYLKFAALWNGQKVFRNTSGSRGTSEIFQERYVKRKCNVLFSCLVLKK